MSDNRLNAIRINELPESTTLSDSDIMIHEDSTTTHKITLATLAEHIKGYINNLSFFVRKDEVNVADGVAPLDENKKILSENIDFGKSNGQVYEGSEGKALETSVNMHILDDDIHVTTNDKEKWNNAEKNVQSDYEETDATSDAFILNKPTIPSKTSELTNDSDFVDKDDLNTKLSLAGGSMEGDIDMGAYHINNLSPATTDNQAVTYSQLKSVIASVGTYFNLKGSKSTYDELPTTDNNIGDVWYVEEDSVGYLWLEDTTGTIRWEELGKTIDLSGYLPKSDLLQTTGSSTDNTMSQNAITENLKLKANTSDLAAVATSGNYTDLDGLEDELNNRIVEVVSSSEPSLNVGEYWIQEYT